MDRIKFKNITRKGKAKITLLSILCAVLLGCTGFGFAGLFGADLSGLTDGNVTVASAATGDIGKGNVVLTTAEQTAKNNADGTSAKPYIITSATDWTNVVVASMLKGASTTVYAKLATNWTAQGGSFGGGRGFGLSYTVDGTGGLYIPEGANISLDLAGYAIDRNLTTGIETGWVLMVYGTFEVTDSSTAQSGKITGGFVRWINDTYTTYSGAGVCIMNTGNFTLKGGSICDNIRTAGYNSTGGAGVGCYYGTFTMTGGSVKDNISRHFSGGIYGLYATINISGGEISGNICSDSAGGIRSTASTLNISGSPKIIDNYRSATIDASTGVVTKRGNTRSDLNLPSGKINIVGKLGDDTTIGINAEGTLPITFTNGYGKWHPDGGKSSHFFASTSTYSIGTTGSGTGLERTLVSAYDQTQWADAVNYSIQNKVRVKVRLSANWTATDGSFGSGVGYGYTNVYTSSNSVPQVLNPVSSTSGNILVPAGADIVLDLNGKTIDRKLTAARDGGMVLCVQGTLEVTDTTTAQNGKITGGRNSWDQNPDGGGGVFVTSGGNFTLSGGDITGNYGGRGGAVDVTYGSTFTMTGGNLYNNLAWLGGGVYVNGVGGTSHFYLLGGSIHDNAVTSAGGAFRSYLGKLYISGSPKVYSNLQNVQDVNAGTLTYTGGSRNDVYLVSATDKFEVIGKLVDAYVGVRTEVNVTETAPYVFTINYGKYNTEAPSNFFYATQSSQGVDTTGSGTSLEARLAIAKTSGTTDSAMATAWSNAVTESIDSKKQVYFKLTADWTAKSNSFGSGVGFGTYGYNYTTAINKTSSSGSIVVPNGANIVLDLNGHTIDRGLGTATAAVANAHCIFVQGTLEITDTSAGRNGKITGGYTDRGAGISVANGNLTISAGQITGNKVTNQGGGVYAYGTSTLTFSGGSFTNNSSVNGSPAIFVAGTFNMSGGTISNNTCNYDYPDLDGAVALESGTKAYISGGTITQNRCGQVIGGGLTTGRTNSVLYLSGNPVISGNFLYDGKTACNLSLINGKLVNFNGALTAGANIGITVQNANVTNTSQVVFTSGYSSSNSSSPLSFFTSDKTTYKVGAQVNVDTDVLEGCLATQAYTYLSRKPTANASVANKTYDGNTVTLVSGVNLAYMNVTGTSTATEAGTYNTQVTPATGCYWPDSTQTPVSVSCTIAKRNITDLADTVFVIAVSGTYTYTGSAIKPTITVTDKGVATLYQSLNSTNDYTISNKSNTNASTSATVTLEGKGNYTGTKTITFTIGKATLTDASTAYSGTYDGSAHGITVSATGFKGSDTWANAAGKTIKYRTAASGDYTLTANPTETNVVSGKTVYYQITFNNYNTITGSKTITISNATITGTVSNQSWTYDGATHQIINNASSVTDSAYTKNGISLTTVNSQTQTWKFSTTSGTDWSTVTANNNLTFKNVADGKTVYYQVSAPNHTTKTGSFTVSISKATLTDASTAYNAAYDGSAHGITVSATGFKGSDTWANASGKTITYGLTSGTYDLTANPTATDVADSKTNVYYKVTFDNYKDITGSKALTITQKAITAITLAQTGVADGKTYDGNTTGKLINDATTGTAFTSAQIVTGDVVNIASASSILFDNANVGTGKTVTVKGITLGGADSGNYSIAATVAGTTTAAITAFDITNTTSAVGSGASIADLADVTYTGAEQAQKPVVKVKLTSAGDTTLAETTDYTLAYANSVFGDGDATGAGLITVTITATGNYTGTRTITYNINKATISAVEWNSGATLSFVYDGAEHKPVITTVTTDNNGDLASNAIPADLSDMFSYAYKDSKDNNSACTEKDDYSAIATLTEEYAKNFVFSSALKGDSDADTEKEFSITNASMTLSVTAYTGKTYDGAAHYAFTDKDATIVETAEGGNNNLKWWFWYDAAGSVSGWQNVAEANWSEDMPQFTNAGSYKVFYKATADNHSANGGSYTITINKKSITGAYSSTSGNLNGSILPSSLDSVPYTGNAYTEKDDLTIEVMLTASDRHTLQNTDTVKEYTLAFSNNIKAGTATITINGSGNYNGTRTINFTISKADITGITVTPYSGTYDGQAHDVIGSSDYTATLVNGDDDTANTATWYFRIDGTEAWSLTMPTLTDATTGTKVFYKITAPNHNDIEGATYFETVVIDQKDISADYRLNDGKDLDDMKYTGSALEPTFKVEQELTSGNWTELDEGDDFDFSYSGDHTEVGEVTVTVTGKGNYKGTNTITFNIIAADGMTASAEAYGGTAGKIYDGLFHAAVQGQTVTAVGGNDGNNVQWWYSYEDLDADSTEWSDKVPEIKNATEGTTVYWMVTADNNAPVFGNVEVKITPKQITAVAGIAADGKVYDGLTYYASGDNGSVQADGNSAGVKLDDAIKTNLTGYLDSVEDYDGSNKITREDDLIIVWADGVTDEQKGTFESKNKGVWEVTVPYASLALAGEDKYNYELNLTENIVISGVEISARVVELSWTGLEQTWDNNKELKPTATVSNLVTGDNVTTIIKITQNGNEVSSRAPGEYNVEVTALNGSAVANYTITGAKDLEKTFTITTTNTVVYFDATGLTYDGTAKMPKIYYEAVVDGEKTEVILKDEIADGTSIVIKDASGKTVDSAINAGTYTVTLTLDANHVWDGDLNGNQKTKTITFTVAKATVAGVKLEGDTVTYDGSAHKLSVDWSEATLNGEAITAMPDGITVTVYYNGVASDGVTNAGAYKVTAIFTVNGNFESINPIENVELTIDKAAITLSGITFEDKTEVFSGSVYTITVEGTVDEKLSVSYAYAQGSTNYGTGGVSAVGEYTVTATFAFRNAADKDNYYIVINGEETTTLTATLTINKEAANVTDVVFEDSLNEVYDGNVHRLLVSGAATGVKSVAYEYATDNGFTNIVSTDGVKDAGTYYVRATFTVDGNYAPVEPMVRTLKIAKAELTVKANDKTITYGDNPRDAAYTATYTGLVGTDTESSIGTVKLEVNGYSIYGDAGIYEGAIKVTGPANTTNYTVTYENGDLTVKPYEVTVKWYNTSSKSSQDLTYTYDGTEKKPYAEVSNAIPGRPVTVNVEGGQTAVGMNYEATAKSLSNSNYALPESGLTVTFDILPAAPKSGKIIWDYTTLYYNGKEQAPKAYFFENENDNAPKELKVTVNKTAINAGDYVATVLLDGSYTLTGETQLKFRIEKRTVHVVIDDYSAAYTGTIDFSGATWSYANGSLEFVPGENYTINFSCGNVEGPDTYPLYATFSSVNSANYEVIFSGSWSKAGDTENNGKWGTLTVTSAKYDMSKVSFTGAEVTYDGNAHVLSVSGLPAGVTVSSVSYLLDGWNLGSDGATAAGTYKVIFKFEGSEYFEAISDIETTLTIKKAALSVKANDNSIVYGDEVSYNGVTYTINGVTYSIDDDKLKGELTGTLTLGLEDGYAGNAGKYRIIPAGLSAANYEITFVPGTLTVSPREITVTWYSDSSASSTNLNYNYDGNKHTPYPVANGLLGTDKVEFSVDGGQTEAGLNYKATITAVSNGNYTVSNASVEFSIVQKGVIIWDNTPLYYEKGVAKAPKAWYYDEDEEKLKELTVTVDGEHVNAGEYTATVTAVPAGISDANKSITYKILPQEITITIGNAADLVYGKVEGAGNLEKVLADLLASLGLDDITITLECNVNNSSAVGTYTITGNYDGKNYKVTFVNGSLTIVKADVVDNGTLGAFDGKTATVTYDGKAHTVEVSGTLPAGVTGVTYKYYSVKLGKYVTESEVVNAGEYRIEAYFTVDGNHNEVGGTYTATLTIEQAELTVKFDKESYEFDYDGKLHSAKVTGDLTGVKSVKYLYDGEELTGVKNAGTYTVTVEIQVEDEDNYKAITLGSVTLTINKVELTVTANDGSIVYGTNVADIENFGYTLTGLAASDASAVDEILGTVSYNYGTVNGAGVYDIKISGNASSANYSKINYVDGKLTVTPYTLTASNIQWTDKEDGAPATDGKFVYTYKAGTVQQPYAVATGLIGSDTITFVVEGGQINAGYGYQAQIVSIGGTNAKNYMLPAEGLYITFDILPAPVTGTIIWDNSPLYYDGTNRQPKAYYFLEEGGQRLELPVTVEGDSKNVGTYTATVNTNGIGVELSGDKSKEFNVVARQVYVEIGNLDVQYGDTPNMSAVSWKYVYDDATKQFLAGEAFSITFSCGASGAVGTYPISAQFISANAENYEVIFTGNWASAGADNGKYGTLTIFKASYDMSKVTFVGTSVTYDGKLHTVSVIGLPEGVEVASVVYEKDGFGYDANGVKNVGVYTVTVKFSGNENYGDIEDLTATLTINKAALTIKANDKTIIYGEQPSANGVTYSGFAEGEEEANDLKGVLSYTYGYVFGGNVGKYDIVPSGFTSENYEITYKIGTLTVAPRTITVTWYDDETLSSQSFVYDYDEQHHAPYAVAGNLVDGDSLTLTVTGATDLPGFNFVASVGELTNANYKLPNDGTTVQTFSVMPAPVYSIVWDNTPIYYNGQNLRPKAYYVEEDGSWTEITDVRVTLGGVTQSNYKNVGLYTATAIYKGVSSSQAYNILPVVITVEIKDTETVYGTMPDMSSVEWKYADGSNEFIASDLIDGAPLSFRCPTVNALSSVGKYEILGSCTNGNYTVTFVSGTLTIVKASHDMSGVVYGGLTATYDGEYHTVSISNLPEGVTATVTYEKDGKVYGSNGVSDAGEYKVTVSFTVQDIVNYNSISDVELTLTVEKKAADVTGIIFHNTTKTVTYNGKVQEAYVSGTATGVTSVIYTYYEADGVSEIEGGAINAGTYKVKAEFTFDSNYSGDGIGAMWATLVIKQAKLTVTASDGSVVYGDAADVNGYGYTVTGLVSGDSEEDVLGTITFSYDSYSDAKVYADAIIISGNETAQNYEIEYVYGTLTVTPREITVTWYDEEGGTAGTEFEYEYEEGKEYIPYAEAGNLADGDTLALDVKIKREDAGDNYVATVQALTNGNYTLPAGGITVNFTIKYSEEDLDEHLYELVWDNDTLYYNKDAQTPSARYYDGTDWVDVTDDLVIKDKSGNPVDAITVGEYVAEYVPDTDDETITFKNLTFSFEIAPRKVYITIGDMQIKFGETPDMSKVSWKYADGSEEFIAGDAYTLTFSVEEITSAKKYPITGIFGGNANYEVIFTGASWATSGADNGAYGTLTVNKATYDMSRVTFSGIDVTYDGTSHEITVNGTPAGVTYSVAYTRSGWTYNGVTNAGAYTVTVSFAGDENHEAIADMTATLTVRKAALTVTANDNSIVYGDAPKAAGVTYEGLAASDTDESGAPKASVFSSGITYEYNYLKGGKVGEYNITPKGLTAENYVITYVSGTLTVNKRIVTVTWYNNERMDSQSLTYNVDGNTHLPYAEAGNVVVGDSVVLTVDPSCAQSKAGINYQAKIVAISNSNYALPENVTVYFEIIPEAYVVVWESAPFVFNGENQAPNAYYYTVNGERVSLRVTVQEGESVEAGTYHASASLITGNVELTGELTNHEFTIAKREVTVIINDATSAYGEEIVLAGWTYAEGSLHFASGEPFYIVPPATSSSAVGEYVITGRCTDDDNYIVTVINGKYTITKALITAPEIASKVYNGELQIADIVSTDRYLVILNDGGKNVGTYRVILLLTDYSNCKWADTNSQQYYVEFVITQAENEWTTEFEVHGSVVAGSGEMFITAPEAKFGNSADVVIKYYTNASCEDRYEVSEDYIVTDAASGTYYAKVTLAGAHNYNELSTVYSFSVTGSLAIRIIWSNTTLTYNGNLQAPEAYIWLGDEQVMLIVTGAQKDAGTYEAQTSLKAVDGRDLSGYEISNSDTATKVEYTINARSITISIDDDASSVYGSPVIDLSRINWSIAQGSVMSGDELGITFRCAVTDVEFADAGEYPIIGECANGNYDVTFVGSWSGEDEYNGKAATYTVRKAVITVSKSESTWVDEEGLLEGNKNYFVYLDQKDEDGNYKYITTKGGQEATVYYSTNIDKYTSVHDGMTESDIAQMFADGGSSSAPEIKQVGNFVIYYRIEAENHEVKYGIWKVLIQPKDRYIMITFTKPYQVTYGDSVEGKDLIDELIDGGYIEVSGRINDLETLREIARAYAYEDVGSDGFVNESTDASKYSIRLVFTDLAANSDDYRNIEFRYSTSNNPNSDTNYDKYEILQRPIFFGWTETTFTYDGELHLPSAKITGLVGGEEYLLTGLQLGANVITLANGDIINATVELIGNGDLTAVGSYHLRLTIDNANYRITQNSDLVDVNVTQREVSITWDKTSFEYDGNRHIPEATVTIGDEVFTLKDIVIGAPIAITLANGEVINVTVSLVGNSDMATGDYELSVSIDDPNYKLGADSQKVKVSISGYEEPFKFVLPEWGIYAIGGSLLFLLLLIIILIVVLKKRKPAGAFVDEDGFSDPVGEDD